MKKDADFLAAKRKARDDMTLAHDVDRYLSAKLVEFRYAKNHKQWWATLDTSAAPVLGRILLPSIEARHDVRLKQPIRGDKTEATSRLRRRIEVVLPRETVAGHRAGDRPARWKGNLADLSPKPIKVPEAANHHALALPDLPRLWQVPDTRERMAARALQSEVHYP